MSLVVDTSFVLAVLDISDSDHARCLQLAESTTERFVVPMLTLPEIDYLLRREKRVDVWETFVGEIAGGSYSLHAPDETELQRAAELEVTYADLRLGLVDASVVATCETVGETKLATLDRRHFGVVRPRHCDTLTLLPE